MTTQTTRFRHPESKLIILDDLTRVKLSVWNPNEMLPEEYEQLKRSMYDRGIFGVDPIDVFPAGVTNLGVVIYQVWNGNHRVKAARELKWTRMRAFVHQRMTEEEARVLNYMKNKARGRINPVKEAELFFEFWERGKGKLTQREIGEKFSVSQVHVSERLGLLKLPEPALKAVESGDLKTSHAEEVYRSAISSEHQTAVARVVASEKLTPNQTQIVVEQVQEELQETPDADEKFVEAVAERVAQEVKQVKPSEKPHSHGTTASEFAEIVRSAPSKRVEDFVTGPCPWCGKDIKWMGRNKFVKAN